MVIHLFGVETEKDADAINFFTDSIERAKSPGLHAYFAEWFIVRLKSPPNKRSWAVTVSSGFPDAWKMAAAVAALPLLFTGFVWSWWVVPGVTLWMLSFLSSTSMRYITLRLALRKNGYSGKIQRLSKAEVMRRVMREQWLKK